PPTGDDNVSITGVTVVPIPAKTTYLPDADGPAMWLQIDVDTTKDKDLGSGWTLRFRGQIDAGFRIPLTDVSNAVAGQTGGGGAAQIELGKDPDPTRRPLRRRRARPEARTEASMSRTAG